MRKCKINIRRQTMLFIMIILALSILIGNHVMYASGSWRGYAAYRNGVAMNINDHAGLMNKNSYGENNVIIHAPGSPRSVEYVNWNSFLDGNVYLGIYKPRQCTITTTIANSFVAKARELIGTPYTLLEQIRYNAGDNYWVLPENITHLRCDGVIEYVYEWYSWRVGGRDRRWDITRNSVENWSEHTGFLITPRKQRQELLNFVTSNFPQ